MRVLSDLGAVLVAAGAVDGEVAGLLVGEEGILLLHPLVGIAAGGVFARAAARGLALVPDPLAQALADALFLQLAADLRRRADRKSTSRNSRHQCQSRMQSSA